MTDTNDTKAREHRTWSSVVPGWQRHNARLTESFRAVSERLLTLANIAPGDAVLDVACGTGEPAIPAAQRVGASGRVLATDFVADMVAFARDKATKLGLAHLEFRVADGEMLDVPPASFDAATMRWGLMFMPTPVACLERVLAALKPGGALAVACWAGPEHNPWAAIPMATLKRYMELPAPQPGQTGIFAFADPERLRAVMMQAGFTDVQVESLQVTWRGAADGSSYFREVVEMAGPLAALYAKLSDADKDAYAAEVAKAAEAASAEPSIIAMPGMTWLASGRRAG